MFVCLYGDVVFIDKNTDLSKNVFVCLYGEVVFIDKNTDQSSVKMQDITGVPVASLVTDIYFGWYSSFAKQFFEVVIARFVLTGFMKLGLAFLIR